MSMAISEHSYNDLKEYWDFQRKLEYNREILKRNIQEFSPMKINPEMSHFNEDQIFDFMWARLDQDDYEDPPTEWTPKNEEYRLWNESEPLKQLQLPKPKGRPVVLRAKKVDTSI